VKEFLSQAGVAFESKNVDEDEQAYSDLIQRGYRTIPVTFIGDIAIKGFDPAALRAALDARSSPGR
jgi:adenosylhomocysteine nucleosidase